MGQSFTEYRGTGFWCRDSGLELWAMCLVDGVDALSDAEPWLRAARDHWWLQASVGFLGCVSLRLDQHCPDDARAARVIEVAMHALDELRARGVIAMEHLNARGIGGPGTRWESNVGATFPMKVGELFLALLEGRVLPEGGRDSRAWHLYLLDDTRREPPSALVRPRRAYGRKVE